MLTNKAVVFAVVAALAEQATAFNAHRHLHQLEKRAADVNLVTVWDTVYVTPGQPHATSTKKHRHHNEGAKPTITSTTSVVVPDNSGAPVIPQAFAAEKKHTTLATVKKGGVVDEVSLPPLQNQALPTTPIPTPSPVPTPTPTPTPSPPPGGAPFSSKRGLAYNDPNLANLFGGSCSSCAWGYNWASNSEGLDPNYNYIPMLWGDTPDKTDPWDTDAEAAISAGSKALFSFNEPDNGGQAAMSPEQAAQSHATWMNKYHDRVLIGAPAISNSGNPGEGLDWLKSFFAACDAVDGGCAVDFCNLHWYSQVQYQDDILTHLEEAHDVCGDLPLWLTEFAPDPIGSDDEMADFMNNIIPQLDQLDYLDAYSYYMVSDEALMSGDAPSSYGQLYADA